MDKVKYPGDERWRNVKNRHDNVRKGLNSFAKLVPLSIHAYICTFSQKNFYRKCWQLCKITEGIC